MTPPPAPATTVTPPAAANALVHRLVSITHDLLAAADTERRLVWTNPAWQPLLGWSAEELAAESYHGLVHPEDLDRVKAAEAAVLSGRAGERPETELRLRGRDGDYRWFVFSTSYARGERNVYFSGKDITARKAGEEELRAADERFRAVTGSTRDGIVSADARGRVIFWNAGAAQIFGYEEGQALGMALADLMPERYRDAHRAGLARFLATGEGRVMGSTVELEGLRADGSEFPLELSLGTWSQGGAICFSAVVRDVSDRVRARRALREAEERFAGAFEGAAVGMLLAAPDGTVLRANRALSELLGSTQTDLAGRTLDSLLHPEDRGADAGALTAMLAGRTQRLATERRIVTGAGETRYARLNLSLIRDTDGAPLHFVGQVEDVTERRRMLEALTLSEARYKALITNLPDSTVHLVDTDLRLVLAEGEQMALHGYVASEIEGRPIAETLPAAAYERLLPEFRAALRGERRSFDHESTDGRATYWIQITPLRDDVGHIVGAMALSRDITARRQAELALEERAQELERSNAELEQFAYIASHDLSEPLRMVSSYLQLLRRRYHGKLDGDADEFIDYAVDGAARMRDLIDDLLSYSRAGRGEHVQEMVDSGAIVERVLDHLSAQDNARPCRITVGALPAVRGDESQLGQLFQNVLGNAIKFVPEDREPEVRVEAEREGRLWRFSITDNGIGIDPTHGDRIFRMFQRLHTRDDYPGTGIGLAIAKKVVERHGGTMWAEPAPDGPGTRFCFTLPAGGSTA